MKDRPKLIIFDLDGTLVEFPTEFILSEAERILPELEHPPVPRSTLAEHFAEFDFFRFVEHSEPELFIERFWSRFDWASYPKPIPFGWSSRALSEIGALGIRMALATARLDSEEVLRADLHPTGLLEHLDVLCPRPGDHIPWKDKTYQIEKICAALDVPAAHALLVGDIPADIISAREAGLGGVVAVLSGGIRREILEAERPDALLEHVGELPALLRLAGERKA